jgi:hypothetical protein
MTDILGDGEELVRVLFTDRMTSSVGELEKEAFPVDELITSFARFAAVNTAMLRNGAPAKMCSE